MNLKLYPEASGAKAVALATAARKLDEELGVGIAICPQPWDVRACAATGGRIFAQHVDVVAKPESTGWLGPAAAKEAGCEGTLLNHSEHRLDAPLVARHLAAATKAGLTVIVCTKDSAESTRLAALKPPAVAVEPPGLIGGAISVTTADPTVVSDSVDQVRLAASSVLVLCGAGVKTGDDARMAKKLGAHGVLVASGVAKARWPSDTMRDLAESLA